MPDSSLPAATYRLQFNADFRFSEASVLLDYLANLGITDVYASPILTSRKGSAHGYDVTDPTQINPEFGSPHDFEQFEDALRERGMRLILDIVPNHMAASSENRWWMDVLENGSESGFASYFDIDWRPPSRNLEGKVLLPVLGRPFGEALDRGDLRLLFEDGKFFVQYFELLFPLTPRSYRRLLKHRMDELRDSLSGESPAYQEYSGIIAALSSLQETAQSEGVAEKRVRLDGIRERLQRLIASNPEIAAFIDTNIAELNARPGDIASLCPLERLLGEQNFLLAYWQDPNEGINYRRFFTISDLVGVRVEDPIVFEATHDQVLHLATQGVIRGVRVDHIDGLRDPLGYLTKLQERLIASQSPESSPPYVLVEKILSRDEALPDDWPVSGTTGYEYLNAANGLCVNPTGASKLEKAYFDFIGREMSFADVMYEKKKLVMHTMLRVEMQSLGRQLAHLAARDRYARNLLRPELMDALIDATACLSVYRTYIRNLEVPDAARQLIEGAIEEARTRRPQLNPLCFDFVRDVLTLTNPPHILSDQREERLGFVMRWQQFTGPIVAKGLEDTALYAYYPLLSLNEVGGSPEPSKIMRREDFYEFMRERQKRWPDSLNGTSTHDTKRSEDVRARLDVLSEVPEAWAKEIAGWSKENESRKLTIDGRKVPDANEEYLIYQTLVGLWPAHPSELPSISARLQSYAVKAIREAMVHTRWTEPNTAHERAVCSFIEQILAPQENAAFLSSVAEFLRKIVCAGMINSLGQALLKIVCPGIPDFYQGSELWDFHLVDPDNRGAVDFRSRTEALQGIADGAHADNPAMASDLLEHWLDGRIKLYVIWKALGCRRERPTLFRKGEFLPVEVIGDRSEHVISFLRQYEEEQILVVVPRWVVNLTNLDTLVLHEFLGGTKLKLPLASPHSWRNVFTARTIEAKPEGGNQIISAGELLNNFPVALLTANTNSAE
jgi:(1->4)-alpha-D-glucan 1-alpha-D-glucosylmutase